MHIEYYFFETYNLEGLISTELLHSLGAEGWTLRTVETISRTRRYTFTRVKKGD